MTAGGTVVLKDRRSIDDPELRLPSGPSQAESADPELDRARNSPCRRSGRLSTGVVCLR